jgi:hypothetical protein
VLGALFGILAAGLWAALVNMGLLPIEVFIYRAEEPDAAVDPAKPGAKRARRRKAIGE